MKHIHALALAGRRILSRTDSDCGSASKAGKSVRANLSHTLPTARAAVATATPSAGATASIHLKPRAPDAQSSRPGQLARSSQSPARAAEAARGGRWVIGCLGVVARLV